MNVKLVLKKKNNCERARFNKTQTEIISKNKLYRLKFALISGKISTFNYAAQC